MIDTGICSAFDYAIDSVNRINPLTSSLVDLPIARYGLDQPPVLNAIARLAQRGAKNQVRAYNERGVVPLPEIAPADIQELFLHSKRSNCTFNIEHIERHVPEACAMAVDLSATFGGTIAIHAFVTASGVPATPLHYDYSNAFTFQLCGTKWWKCYDYRDAPTYGPSGYVVNQEAVGVKTLDHVLQPGESLFIPKGGLHLVTALPDQDSLHLAVSVKPLSYHKYMSQLLDPALGLDHPQWVGTEFAAHIRRIARGAQQVGELATGGDIDERARNAVWSIIYEAYNACPYPVATACADSEKPRSFARAAGRPLAAIRGANAIALEFLDPEPGPVGNYGFRPASVQLPNEAEPFMRMLETGTIDTQALASQYDLSTILDLLNLSVELGFFTAN